MRVVYKLFSAHFQLGLNGITFIKINPVLSYSLPSSLLNILIDPLL